MAKKKAKTDDITVSLKLGQHMYEGKGATMLDALSALKRPEKIMVKGTLTITQGDKRIEQLILPPRAKRLFYNHNLLAIQAKQLEAVLR